MRKIILINIFLLMLSSCDSEQSSNTGASAEADKPPSVKDKTISLELLSETEVNLVWNAAKDDITAQKNLKYQVYFSNKDLLKDKPSVEAATKSGSILSNKTSKIVSDLDLEKNYYFNVMVMDESNNKTIYETLVLKPDEFLQHEAAEDPNSEKGSKKIVVPPKSEDVVQKLDTQKGATIGGSGAQVSIAAGSLQLSAGANGPVAISVSKPLKLASTNFASDLSVDSQDVLNASPGVLMTATNAVDIVKPLDLALPYPKDPLALGLVENDISNLAVIYKVYDSEKEKVVTGIIPPSELEVLDSFVHMKTSRFGSFYAIKMAHSDIKASEVTSSKQQILDAKSQVILDDLGPGAPIFYIDQPAYGVAMNQYGLNETLIKGYCDKNGKILVISGDHSANATCLEHSWSTVADFSSIDGDHIEFEVSYGDAKDLASHVSRAYKYELNYELTFTLDSHEEGEDHYISKSTYNSFSLNGSCSEHGRPIVVSGSITAEFECIETTWYGSLDFSDIEDGQLELTLTHTNQRGDELSITRTFIKNTVTPILAISYPQENSYISSDNLTNVSISGSCSHHDAKVDISGAITASVSCHSSFSYSADFTQVPDGNVELVFSQTDDKGNTGSTSLSLIKNTQTPFVSFQLEEKTLQGANLNITNYASDEAGDATLYTGNADTYQWSKVSGPGTVSFSQQAEATTINFSSIGTYVISVTATSNSVSAQAELTVVVSAPDQTQRASAPSNVTAAGVAGASAIDLFWLPHEMDGTDNENVLVVYFQGSSEDWASANNWRPSDGTSYSDGQSIDYEGLTLTVGATSQNKYGGRITGLNIGDTYYFQVYGMDSLKYYSTSPATVTGSPTASIDAFLGSYGGISKRILQHENHLYVGMSGSSVNIFSISGSVPSLIKTLLSSGNGVKDMLISNQYLFVLLENYVSIFDIATPAAATKVAEITGFSPYNFSKSIAVLGTRLYIGEGTGNSVIYDISDINNPSLLTNSNPMYYADRMIADESNNRILSLSGRYFKLWDLSSPSSPSIIDEHTEATYSHSDIATLDNTNFYTVYISNPYTGIKRFSLNGTPEIAQSGGVWQFTPAFYSSNPRHIKLQGQYAYLHSGKTLAIADTNESDLHTSTATLDLDYEISDIALDGSNNAFVSDSKGITVVDISAPLSPNKGQSYEFTLSDLSGIAYSGNYAFVTSGSALKVIDLSDHNAPQVIYTLDLGASTRMIYVHGNYAFVGFYSGFTMIDLSDPTTPVQKDSEGSFEPYHMVANNQTLFVTGDNQKLMAFDISDPDLIVAKGDLDLSGPKDLVYHNNKIIVSDDDSQGDNTAYLKVVDASDLDQLSLIKTVSHPCEVLKDLKISGTLLVGSQDAWSPCSAKMNVFDISDFANPTLVNSISLETADEIQIKGNYAIVAGGRTGLVAIDLSDPTNLSIEAAYTTPKDVSKFILHNNNAVAIDNDMGIYIINSLP